MAVTDDAIEKIRAMIIAGELRPGDRLPREVDLAERLSLSRNSLREAVKAMSLMKILDVRQGDGTYVTNLDTAMLINAMAFVVDLHRDDTVLQFLEVRRLLEPAATAAAARRITADEVASLEQLLDELGPEPTVEELVENDLAFHRSIAQASGNPVLSSIIVSMSGPTQRARTWRGLRQASAVEQTMREHHAILAAVKSGNDVAAHAWATVHIAGVEDWLRAALADTAEYEGQISPVAPGS